MGMKQIVNAAKHALETLASQRGKTARKERTKHLTSTSMGILATGLGSKEMKRSNSRWWRQANIAERQEKAKEVRWSERLAHPEQPVSTDKVRQEVDSMFDQISTEYIPEQP